MTKNRRGDRNMFRNVMTGKLNKEYLRICAVYKLLKSQRVGRARACELLAARRVECPKRLVEMWCNHPLKHLSIAS